MQHSVAIVDSGFYEITTMNKPVTRDIASFPELFDGMEAFLEEEARALKKISLCLSLCLGGIATAAVMLAIFQAA